MLSKAWEEKGLLQSGKTIEHASMYGTDLSKAKNAESMTRMFVGLPAEVITQGLSKIHEKLSKFFCAEYFEEELEDKESPLAPLHAIQNLFIIFQNRCVLATDELSISVIETAGQRPAQLKDIRTKELTIDLQF
jgi:hypothetical protein